MDELLLYTTICLCLKKKQRKVKRRWVKDWLNKRATLSHLNLMSELTLEPSDWRNYMRMDEDCYLLLLKMVTPLIKKKDTNMRQSITPHERLAATLRFLASGMSYEELKFPTTISAQRLGVIIPETCLAITKCLKNYIKMTDNAEEWTNIAERFENRWNFPNCVGAWDGKHIRITPPPGSGSYFWNYKKFHSIVLMACANADYEFIWVEVGTNGRISDGGVMKNTQFYDKLNNGQICLPQPKPVNGSMFSLPYVFVGDEAFSLRTDFMKPFNQKTLTPERRIFNYRLSRCRRIIENVFGILANRFRIFHSSIAIDVQKIETVVLCCCILHNFLRKSCARYMSEDEIMDISAFENSLAPLERNTGNSCIQAKAVREMYVDYFNGEGAVHWQNDHVAN